VTVSLTTTPTYPLPGKVRVTVSCSAGNAARLYVRAAPLNSKYQKEFKKRAALTSFGWLVPIELPGSTGAEEYKGTIGNGQSFDFDADAAGSYKIIAQEVTIGATAFGGGYDSDPDAYPSVTLVGGQQTLSLYTGERFESRLGNSTHGRGTLVVYAWDDTIRPTSVATHGVATPAVINPSGALAEAAMFNNTVQTKLDALVGKTTTNLSTDLWTLIAEMRLEIADHMGNTGGTWHSVVDNTNDVYLDRLPTNDPGTPDGWAFAVRTIQQRLALHMSNGPDGTSLFHQPGTGTPPGHPDYENVLIADTASGNDMSTVMAAVADIYRAYEAHRAEGTPIHASADSGANNDLTTALNPLLDLHKEFLNVMRIASVSVPDEMSNAAARLPALGFRKANS